MTVPVTVRPVLASDEEAWRGLYASYAGFYERGQTDADRDRVWGWLLDPGHPVGGLVAVVDGAVVGLAHHRLFARPLAASTGLYLDDLYVDPSVRGLGVGRSLLAALDEVAQAAGATLVRWITAADNGVARRLYDDVASATTWVTYDREVPLRG